MQTTPVTLLGKLRQTPEAAAWQRFVQLYTPLLFAWARSLGLQDSDAADLVQDVFVLLVRKLPDFEYDRQKSFRCWLRTVTLNAWRDIRRRRAARPAEVSVNGLPEPADVNGAGIFEEAEYQRFLLHKALQLMQAEFSPTTWRACWEHVMADRPADEVAAELGICVGAVYVAKSRVLRRLREELRGLID